MVQHARLSPSACSRWSTCTASVALIDDLKSSGVVPERSSSIYAAEGTVAHEVREDCLRLGLDPHNFIGVWLEADGFKFLVTEEMAEYLLSGIDWIREHTESPDVEIRVDLSKWLPGQFGTMDAGWMSNGILYASDLKYGMGEPVSPDNNPQQMLYALGYWAYLGFPDFEKLVIHIDQPRAGGHKFWECDKNTLIVFGESMENVYAQITSGDTVFKPSEKACRWCEAKNPRSDRGYLGCQAYNKWQESFFEGAFDEFDETPHFPEPDNLSPERRYYIVKHSKMAQQWLASLHEASLEAALNGTPDPGSKAVIGQKGNRYFTDKDRAAELLVGAVGDDAYKPRQLIGITEAEKLLKPGRKKLGNPDAWEALTELVDQPPGKPVLVPVDDAREAIMPDDYEFDDLPEQGIVSDDDFEDM